MIGRRGRGPKPGNDHPSTRHEDGAEAIPSQEQMRRRSPSGCGRNPRGRRELDGSRFSNRRLDLRAIRIAPSPSTSRPGGDEKSRPELGESLGVILEHRPAAFLVEQLADERRADIHIGQVRQRRRGSQRKKRAGTARPRTSRTDRTSIFPIIVGRGRGPIAGIRLNRALGARFDARRPGFGRKRTAAGIRLARRGLPRLNGNRPGSRLRGGTRGGRRGHSFAPGAPRYGAIEPSPRSTCRTTPPRISRTRTAKGSPE